MIKMCINGCNKRIQPPSNVICADCIAKIRAALQQLVDDMEVR